MRNDPVRRLAAANPVPHDRPLPLPESVRVRSQMLVLGLAALVAVGIGAAVAGVTLSGQPHPAVGGQTRPGTTGQVSKGHPGGLGAASFYNFRGSNPFGSEGTRVTLEQLASDAPSVPLPNSPLANSGNVGSVWETANGSAAIYYPSSDIELMVVRSTGKWDTTGIPAQDLQNINGHTASVAPGIPDANPPVPAQVIMALPSGKALELTGPSAGDLISVAKTLPLP